MSQRELAKVGAKYTKKELMTYEECVDNGYISCILHDIDGDRMVWVIVLKYSKDIEIEGRTMLKPTVTYIYDAVTGDKLSFQFVAENYKE